MIKQDYFKRVLLDEVDSTNNYASKHLKSGDIPACIMAEYQSSGKGQQGNKWISDKAQNLLVSFVIIPKALSPATSFYISKIAALAVSECLSAIIPDIFIKWPNDIIAGNKKIGGILIENTLAGDKIKKSIIGIGLNVNQEKFDVGVSGLEATSLKLELGYPAGREEILSDISTKLKFWIDELDSENFEGINQEYYNSLFGYQEFLMYVADNDEFEARILGVREDGPLILETRDGNRREYAFREVTLKLI